MKAIIYARCSTDENRQDVDRQLNQLRKYCKAFEFEYEEEFEYESSYKGKQKKLYDIIEKIRLGEYQVLLFYSFDRFSRMHPKVTEELLSKIVYQYNCRVIELQNGLDSSKELTWFAVRPMLQYAAYLYSRNLSTSIKEGIRTKKEKGTYTGGRPEKAVDILALQGHYQMTGSFRKAAENYNQNRPKKERISHVKAMELLKAVNKTSV